MKLGLHHSPQRQKKRHRRAELGAVFSGGAHTAGKDRQLWPFSHSCGSLAAAPTAPRLSCKTPGARGRPGAGFKHRGRSRELGWGLPKDRQPACSSSSAGAAPRTGRPYLLGKASAEPVTSPAPAAAVRAPGGGGRAGKDPGAAAGAGQISPRPAARHSPSPHARSLVPPRPGWARQGARAAAGPGGAAPPRPAAATRRSNAAAAASHWRVLSSRHAASAARSRSWPRPPPALPQQPRGSGGAG